MLYSPLLARFNILPCTLDCVNGVTRPEGADENWHHENCPNHEEVREEIPGSFQYED